MTMWWIALTAGDVSVEENAQGEFDETASVRAVARWWDELAGGWIKGKKRNQERMEEESCALPARRWGWPRVFTSPSPRAWAPRAWFLGQATRWVVLLIRWIVFWYGIIMDYRAVHQLLPRDQQWCPVSTSPTISPCQFPSILTGVYPMGNSPNPEFFISSTLW